MDIPFIGEEPEHFSDTDITRIIDAAGVKPPTSPYTIDMLSDDGIRILSRTLDRRRALQYRLDGIAAMFLAYRHADQMPTPSETKKRFEKIENASRRLLEALGLGNSVDPDQIPYLVHQGLRQSANRLGEEVGGYAHHPPTKTNTGLAEFIDYHGNSALRDTVEAIGNLRRWSSMAAQVYADKTHAGQDRNSVNEPLNLLFERLASIWSDIFDQPTHNWIDEASDTAAPFVLFAKSVTDHLDLKLTRQQVRSRIRSTVGDRANQNQN